MSQCTVLSLRDIKQIKRDATREKKRDGTSHNKILDDRAKQHGYRHWADLTKIVSAFNAGCVLAYLQHPLDADEQKALLTLDFKKSDFLYQYASSDLLAREHRVTAEHRALGYIKPEDEYDTYNERERLRSLFRKENPLYGVQLFALPPDAAKVKHSSEEILADIDTVLRSLIAERYGPDSFMPVLGPDYIWLRGMRTDFGIHHSPNLPPELEYTDAELDDMEYATALESTQGWSMD